MHAPSDSQPGDQLPGDPLHVDPQTQVLHVWVNGEARELPAPATVADLVRALALQPAHVAVERNKRLVRRADHAATELASGDRLEIVTFFGGG